MTEKETILIKVIEKAIKNGWKSVLEHWGEVKDIELSTINGIGWVWYEAGDGEQFNLYAIIFDHSFCKAFFGEKKIRPDMTNEAEKVLAEKYGYPAWEYHIQQLALAEDRLKYLESYI